MMTTSYTYTPFSTFLNKYLEGKVQKISIHAGFTCPNRDGKVGHGGCTYCNNQTFSPDYCHTGRTITKQLEEGITFFARKYPTMKYLAYFQAYTNTYGELERLKAYYEEALSVEGVVGLVIGTRPDCMPESLLDYLAELSKRAFVLIEYGVESSHNFTLDRINRGHSWEQSVDAILRTTEKGIPVGLHLILGLPGETHADIINTAKLVAQLPIETIKLHQLQLIRNTRMADEYSKGADGFNLYSVEQYIDLAIDFIEHIPTTIAIERFTSQSPKELLIAPLWGLKNHEFTHKLLKRIDERNTCQGKLYTPVTQ